MHSNGSPVSGSFTVYNRSSTRGPLPRVACMVELSSSWITELRASVTHELLARSIPQILARWASPEVSSRHGRFFYHSEPAKSLTECEQWSHNLLCSVFSHPGNDSPSRYPIKYSIGQKQVNRRSPHARGGIIQECEYQGTGSSGVLSTAYLRAPSRPQ